MRGDETDGKTHKVNYYVKKNKIQNSMDTVNMEANNISACFYVWSKSSRKLNQKLNMKTQLTVQRNDPKETKLGLEKEKKTFILSALWSSIYTSRLVPKLVHSFQETFL